MVRYALYEEDINRHLEDGRYGQRVRTGRPVRRLHSRAGGTSQGSRTISRTFDENHVNEATAELKRSPRYPNEHREWRKGSGHS